MREFYTRIKYTNDGEVPRANARHYCNFVGGNDEKWLVKRLTATLIGHRLFAPFLFALNTRRFALFTRKLHHSIVTLVISEITF